MIARYNRIGLFGSLPGLMCHIGFIVVGVNYPEPTLTILVVQGLLLIVSTVLLVWGVSYHARARGRGRLWGLLGIGGWVGVLLIFMIPDHTVTVLNMQCPECGYDLRGTAFEAECPECGSPTGPMPDRPMAEQRT